MQRRVATASEADSAYALVEEGSAWLRAQGIAQWNPVYPRSRFERDVSDGNVWLWCGAGIAVATVTVLTARPDYYPASLWRDETSAWYLCRFAVARAMRGTSLGTHLLR